MDTASFAKQYPNLAAKMAIQTGKAAGIDMSKPGAALTAMHSDAFKSSMEGEMNATQSATQTRALSRVMKPQVGAIANFDPNADPFKQETAGYQAAADATQRTSVGRGILFDQVMQENKRLGDLASFNETAYKRKRLGELRPTEDIDREILDIRNRALFSKAAMYDNLSNLPYGAQTRAVAAMQKLFIGQIDDLQTLRTARVNDAESKIQEEMDAHNGRVSASQTRLSGLSQAIGILKDQGADETAIAQLVIDHSKEMERLRKTRATGNKSGITDTTDVIAQALTRKYTEEHAGQVPNNDAQQEIKRQAEFIVKNRKDITSIVLGAGGNFDQLKSPETTQTETVPRNRFLQMMPDWLVSPETTKDTVIPGSDVFERNGFGIPYSAADEAALVRKRNLAGIK